MPLSHVWVWHAALFREPAIALCYGLRAPTLGSCELRPQMEEVEALPCGSREMKCHRLIGLGDVDGCSALDAVAWAPPWPHHSLSVRSQTSEQSRVAAVGRGERGSGSFFDGAVRSSAPAVFDSGVGSFVARCGGAEAEHDGMERAGE